MDEGRAVSRFFLATDGVRLHVREYHPVEPVASRLPVVCLPGLARTAADFHRLANALALDGCRVLALDYRGRGLSARDPNPKNYDLRVEAADVLTVLNAVGIDQAIFVGTSRGGLITMMLAMVQPALIAGAVLNDIGPVIEAEGLLRIKGYVGKLPRPNSWGEAVDLLKGIAGAQFTALSEADWLEFAHLTFTHDGNGFELSYDPALMEALKSMDLETLPTLWPQFESLGYVPVLIIRGDNSDLLSSETVAEMMRRHLSCAVHAVPDQGHAPFLTDAPTIDRIRSFVLQCEGARPPRAAEVSSGHAAG